MASTATAKQPASNDHSSSGERVRSGKGKSRAMLTSVSFGFRPVGLVKGLLFMYIKFMYIKFIFYVRKSKKKCPTAIRTPRKPCKCNCAASPLSSLSTPIACEWFVLHFCFLYTIALYICVFFFCFLFLPPVSSQQHTFPLFRLHDSWTLFLLQLASFFFLRRLLGFLLRAAISYLSAILRLNV